MVRVKLPHHLRNLAGVGEIVELEVGGAVTPLAILDELEVRYPMLKGTIRDHATKERRPYLRYFACEEDFSHEPMDTALPDEVAEGKEPFWVIGAIAGG